MAFFFDTSGADFAFKAGQFAEFTLINPKETDAEGNKRLFSIASSPNHKDYIMVATRMRNTAFKNNLKSMPFGEKIRVRGPMGAFTLHSDASKPAVFLAGGIGITPFRSIVEFAAEQKLPHRIYLFYSNRNKAATAFLDDFEKWQQQNNNFKLIATLTDAQDYSWKYEDGRIDESMIKKYLGEMLQNAIFYIAGPPGMVSGLMQLLSQMGIKEESIKAEEFAGY